MTTTTHTGTPGRRLRDDDVAEFLAVRPRLFGVAYRMLGTVADAEDIVQEAWIRWQGTDRSVVRNAAAFLTTTVTRLAINAVTSARARRETYDGPWLPEPVDTSPDPLLGAENAEALELAVLVLLEKLTPTERAAYVLREAFAYSHRQIAELLETSEANARQLARRARQALGSQRSTQAPPERQRELVDAFVAAARDGHVDELEHLLARDVIMWNDGGGKARAARKSVFGAERVLTFLSFVFSKPWSPERATLEVVEANGGPGVLVRALTGEPLTYIALDVAETEIRQVLMVVNPDKLTHVTA